MPISAPQDASGRVSVTAFVLRHVTSKPATMRGETVKNVRQAALTFKSEIPAATPPVITRLATMMEETVLIALPAAQKQMLETASVQVFA